MKYKILITGGRGFIGYNFILKIADNKKYSIFNFDKFSYSSQKDINLFKNYNNVKDYKLDINNLTNVSEAIEKIQPNLLINFAAETHVDRSIESPEIFLKSNILGTYNLLYSSLKKIKKMNNFKFIHISTDEVYGNINKGHANEEYPYSPNSPYSASKASSNHLVRSWNKTFNLPTIITNCSNNYGPYQFPEKLIPLTINNAISKNKILIYGRGNQQRDWIHVNDHVDAIFSLIDNGKIGETYNIGTGKEISNLNVVKKICKYLNKINNNYDYLNLIEFVKDRPGHDKRYAINSKKIFMLNKFLPQIDFNIGIKSTVNWYLNNQKWCTKTLKGRYNRSRLGLSIK